MEALLRHTASGIGSKLRFTSPLRGDSGVSSKCDSRHPCTPHTAFASVVAASDPLQRRTNRAHRQRHCSMALLSPGPPFATDTLRSGLGDGTRSQRDGLADTSYVCGQSAGDHSDKAVPARRWVNSHCFGGRQPKGVSLRPYTAFGIGSSLCDAPHPLRVWGSP